MGLFGKSKKERETEYMSRLDVPSCLKEDFELIIDDIFTIMGVGTVSCGNCSNSHNWLLMIYLQLWELEQLPQETY